MGVFRVTKTAAGLLALPWLVLVATLGFTWMVWDHECKSTQKALHSQFDFALRETVSRIEQRVVAYEQLLRGVQGLLAVNGLNHRTGIHQYVETLQLDANFSGVKEIGVEKWVPLGFSSWSDPVRRLAMEKARNSGMAAISGKVRLLVDTQKNPQPGFIMYLPVFAQGTPRETISQRREHLIGWVFASFHMNDFMASLYGKQSPGLTLSVYDNIELTEDALLYQSAPDHNGGDRGPRTDITAREYMVVAGHTWTLAMGTQPEFETRYGRDASDVVAVIGIILSLSLALLAWLMINGRTRALKLAANMTEELRHMAQHDTLTHLPNRALFSDRLNHELARAKRDNGRFALIFLDLDKFKLVNDSLGHAIGDQLLQQVAQRLLTTIRAVDTAGRLGGDEFVVLMTGLSDTDAVIGMAEKISQTLSQSFMVDGHKLDISGSLGVAVYPEDGITEIDITKSADDAMYRAKESGRDKIAFALSHNSKASRISI